MHVKLQPYRQMTVERRDNKKLSSKYYGPYEIIEKNGKVAYKLSLPPTAQVHRTFHVSLLKRHYESAPDVLTPIPHSTGTLLKNLKESLRRGYSRGTTKLWLSG